MEFEQLSRGYEYGRHRISEMIINACPAVIYTLDSNTLVEHINVIVHAWATTISSRTTSSSRPPTGDGEQMADHGNRIRKYMRRWGKERVMSFIDDVLRIETLIDPANAWRREGLKEVQIKDQRTYREPNWIHSDHNYMDHWLNPPEYGPGREQAYPRREYGENSISSRSQERRLSVPLKDHAPVAPGSRTSSVCSTRRRFTLPPRR